MHEECLNTGHDLFYTQPSAFIIQNQLSDHTSVAYININGLNFKTLLSESSFPIWIVTFQIQGITDGLHLGFVSL
jgi:hypothetical protein